MPAAAVENTEPVAQRVHLEEEESFALRLWALRICYGESSSFGPALPPGWFFEVNDPVLLTYDPHQRTHRAPAGVVAAPLIHAEEHRYYANTALPICQLDALTRRSAPPIIKADAERGFVASRHIPAGTVMAMDVSDIVIVEDPLVWRYPPPQPNLPSSLSVSNKRQSPNLSKKDTVRSVSHMDLGPPLGSGVQPNDNIGGGGGCRVHGGGGGSKLLSAACQIVIHAHYLTDGAKLLGVTGFAQLLASLLLAYGDVALLPRGKHFMGRRSTSSPCAAICRSQRAEALVKRWVRNDVVYHNDEEIRSKMSKNNSKTKSNMIRDDNHVTAISDGCDNSSNSDDDDNDKKDELCSVACLLLRCIPPLLLSEQSGDETSGCIPAESVRHFGFIRRVGLHRPSRLATFLRVFSHFSVPIHVPDLPSRSGCFPFLRHIPHECRPNTYVSFLDSPASHCYGAAGQFRYNTFNKDKEKAEKAMLSLPWGFECTNRVFRPSVAVLIACRDIAAGERVTRAFFPSTYTTQPQRARLYKNLFGTPCVCVWCLAEPDLARAFRCPECPRDCGVICPPGDGRQEETWRCMQCGFTPDSDMVHRMLDEERELAQVKADKTTGLLRLLKAEWMHYSHAIVFGKIDTWCQDAWESYDARMCLEYLDIMRKSVYRVLEPCDPQLAQVHEFTAQVNHAVGSAHTARFEYFTALQLRLRAGMRLAHWTRKTWFMAADKPLTEFLDGI